MRSALPVLVLLLAGCLQADAEASEDDEVASAALEAPPATTPTPTPGEEPATETSEASTAFSWDGSTASAACVADVQCHIAQQPERSWTELDTLDVPGTPVRIRGTLTWDAATPANEDMRLFVFGLAPEGPPASGVELRGPSPLAFDVDLTALAGVGHAISIHGHHEAGPLLVELAQPFHMELEVVSLT